MRAIWKGAVTFGLVNVPVKLYSGTEDHDVPLHQVHDKDGGRIRYRRVCEIDGEEVSYQSIDRAYDDGERTVVLSKEDLASLPAEANREIEVVEFVPTDQIDPIMFDRTYYLEPDSKSPKAYVLLRRTLEETDRTAVVKFALRQRTRLAALRVRDEVLVLQTLLWADEVREADFPSLDGSVTVSDRELAMSAQLVESYEADFTPDEYADEYQVQLRQLIEAKIEQGDALDTAETFGEQPEKGDAEVIDLMEALRRSVKGSKSSGATSSTDDSGAKGTGEKPRTSKAPAKKTPAKKAPAKKAAAKKPAAAKAPAKKPAAKKPAARKKAG
ncbi:Ku protein [Isoptericola sp. NEAU-Y5]|uniref:Non-homologous end joining protein Ku n=1 Tax=Isoptericola luteus TaxID=2879484 RepID=A0ABS7ZFE3_9MICO|nr:Ku protein [Isoptericola sp. NEAU-Y5]MCA5893748.1 Ku protein [Isoptericola sp. NEAU-Y5]